MKELLVKNTNLTPITIDSVLDQVSSLAGGITKKRKEDLRLSLADVEFVDPYGLVSLWGIIRYLNSRFRKVEVVLPNKADILTYLDRMNFSSAVEHDALIESNPHIVKGPIGLSDVLLEMTPIENQEDVENVLRDILGGIGRILKNELEYEDQDITAFSNVVSELCNNILDHSEDKGVVAAQRYTKNDGTKYAVIAVADLGIGIRQSLAKRYREAAGWSNIKAMANALQKEFARNPERGLGLYMVSKIVGDYRGSLHIRSGDARLYLRHRAKGIATAEFPGTQVYISLSVKSENKT